jgi:hypothetical protein
MKIIINSKDFEMKYIKLKNGKFNTKIFYDLSPVYIIGVCLKLNKPYSFYNYNQIEIKNKSQIRLLNEIDLFLSKKISNYNSFFKNNIINIKNKIIPSDDFFININNIKCYHGQNFVNVFCL